MICPVCHAVVTNASHFCADCGARLDDARAQELCNVNYLLSELENWAAQGLFAAEKAGAFRHRYELRRAELRAELAANGQQAKSAKPLSSGNAAAAQDAVTTETSAPALRKRARQMVARAAVLRSLTQHAERRPLFDRLADPRVLRLLLHAGAAMLVVGIVIWLRDALYLKLREPLVQAVLLALGTVIVTISGWLLTLRTRLRLTGRALTLSGALLVPVNFWFLARSGLISNNGRAWIVCALCVALYAHTAALLREKLYVYLAATACVATAWALVYRSTPGASGLYALTLMTASLIFLHLAPVSALSSAERESGSRTVKCRRSCRGRRRNDTLALELSIVGATAYAGSAGGRLRWSIAVHALAA